MEKANYEQSVDHNDDDKYLRNEKNHGGPTIKLKVSYGSPLFDVAVPPDSSFGYLKKLLAPKTGLEPEDQRLFFRGREKDDAETILTAGLKDNSKLLLMEQQASKEKKIEETKRRNEILKQFEAIAIVRSEVDQLSQKVTALQAMVDSGRRVDEKEFLVSSELLMVQLLKLDGVEAEGEAKVQRKNEVRRIQGYVDTLDALKAKNSNPFGTCTSSVSVTTQWETFDDSAAGGVVVPSPSSTKVTQDWERFE